MLWNLVVPHWLVASLAVLPFLIWLPLFAPSRRARRRARRGFCPKCGYDLRATPGPLPRVRRCAKQAWERRMRCKDTALKPLVGTLRVEARPAEPDQRPEASLASRAGDRRGEA